MNLMEFFIRLGVNADTLKLKEFIGLLGDLNLKSIASAIGVGGLYEVFDKMQKQATDTALDMVKFGEVTGLDAKEMYKWSEAAEQMGVGADTMRSSLSGLQKTMLDVATGRNGTAAAALGLIGVTPTFDPFLDISNILTKINDKALNLSPAMKRWVLDSIGINENMMLIANHMDDFYKRQAAVVPLTEEQVANTFKWMEDLRQINTDMKSLSNTLIADLLPALEKVVGWTHEMVQFLEKHKAFTETLLRYAGYTGAGAVVGSVVPGVGTAVGAGAGLLTGAGVELNHLLFPHLSAPTETDRNNTNNVVQNISLTISGVGHTIEDIENALVRTLHKSYDEAVQSFGKVGL